MPAALSPAAALTELKRGVVDLVSEEELLARLGAGKPLRVKAGFDPTRPDLHLGHAVLMNKLRQFQDLGHTVVFIVGDFTAQVGDPTGRNKARPPLTREEIEEGARTYAAQAFKILDRSRTEIRYNSEWLSKLSPDDFVKLLAKRTVARTMERRDFRERFDTGQDIYLHEFLYPLLQAYDSVVVDADIELGGTDQLFNLNVGRDIMGAYGKRPQMVLTVPLLVGTDARWVNGAIEGPKMSKSADNYVGVDEPALEIFKKLMLVNDGVIWKYFELLSSERTAEIDELKRAFGAGELAPREAQRRFAREMVTRLHGAEALTAAEAQYERNRAGAFPADALLVTVDADPKRGTAWIAKAVAEALSALELSRDPKAERVSSTAAKTLVKQGGVQVDGQKVTDEQAQLAPGRTYEVTVGGKNRRYVRVAVKAP